MKAYFPSDWYEQFVEGAARAYWVTAWAYEMEERGKRFPPRSDVEKLAPKTPLDAYVMAGELVGELRAANKASVYGLGARAAKADGVDEVDGHDFGWYLALMSLGHGAGWFDDHNEFRLAVPPMDYHPDIP